jgi:CubicO group peptidase (beta-lactamase class C family)
MKPNSPIRFPAPLFRLLAAASLTLSPALAAEPPIVAPALQPFVDDHTLAGAVTLVASKDHVLDLEAVGWADIAAHRPMAPDSFFWIASQSKPIAATALMLLVDEGKVKVDDPVSTYLPEFKDEWVAAEQDKDHMTLKKPQHPITVKNLLTHTSGLPFKSGIEEPTLDLFSLETRVRSYAMLPLQFEPDSKYQYANAGINTVGRIIEVVSGMPYEKFLEERLFKPLDMKDTTFYPKADQLARIAKSYRPNADKTGLEEVPIGQLKYPLDDPSRKPMPAGGLFSTATDLSHFYRMIMNGGLYDGKRLLSEAAVKQMTSKQTGDLPNEYGFAFSTGKRIGHGGAYNTNSSIDTEHQLIEIFLVQHAGWTAEGKKIMPAFWDAATKAFAPAPAAVKPVSEAKAVAPAPAMEWSKRENEAAVVNRAVFFPAPNRAEAMVGGKITGSNLSPTGGFQVLAEIKSTPKENEWTVLSFPNETPYRWVRYEAPPGSHGSIAELVLFSGDRKLRGTGFGGTEAGARWKAAVDGKTETSVNTSEPDGQYAGFDLGEVSATGRPAMIPGPADYLEPQTVTLKSTTPGATIWYTLDGTIPGLDGGLLYKEPITLDKTTTLVAVAYKQGLAVSPAASGAYIIGQPTPPLLHTFHIGNSLTGNAMRLPIFTRTAGLKNDIQSYLIGGSFTVKLWNQSQGPDKERWDRAINGVTQPLDHFTIQPRDFNIPEEAEYSQRFLNLIREKSPDVQPWLYCEWVEADRQRPSDKGLVPSSEMKEVFPALTWEESMSAMLLYMEEVQRAIAQTDHAGKRVRIIPTALALGWLRNMVDNGKVPGILPGRANFYAAIFEDQVHVNLNGCYLVDLTWYSALYRNSPEGKVLPINTTLTGAQAALFQRLAWDAVKNYPDCGLYEEGAAPCGKPELSGMPQPIKEVTPITLSSSTPGAWFRYTLDGTPPTRTNGYVYCGVISVRPGMTVKAIAYKSGMADSEVSASTWPAAP